MTSPRAALAAVLLMLSLLAMASFLVASRLAVAVERGAAAPQHAEPSPPPQVAARPPEPPAPPREPERRPPSGPAARPPAELAAEREALEESRRELERLLEDRRRQLAEVEHERARLLDRLEEIARLEADVAAARLSREELESKLASLREEMAKLEAEIATVHRELPPKDAVPARRMVAGGSLRPAAFVETDAAGAWLMPERTRLDVSVPPADREAFLARVRAKGYVVFFIRPDGFKAFSRYRDVVEAYNRTASPELDYGYEPVNRDWKLHYPKD